jgi:hypothetical protein
MSSVQIETDVPARTPGTGSEPSDAFSIDTVEGLERRRINYAITIGSRYCFLNSTHTGARRPL